MKTSGKNSKRRSRKLKKVAKRLAAYSAAAAATLMTTQSRSAYAAEVVWDIPDITVNNIATSENDPRSNGVAFHMVTGGTTYDRDPFNGMPDGDPNQGQGGWFSDGNFRLTGYNDNRGYLYGPNYAIDPNNSFANTNFQRRSLGVLGTGTGMSSDSAVAVPIPNAGDFVGPLLPHTANQFVVAYSPGLGGWRNGSHWAYLDWSNGQTAFAGIRFNLGGNVHYGWAQISRSQVDGIDSFTLHGFGYNDTPGAATQTVDVVGFPGNFDGNGVVDGLDFLLWQRDQSVGSLADWEANYGMPIPQLAGDFTGDGKVDGNDFLLWQRDPSVGSLAFWKTNYGMGAPLSAASSSVPEPNSILLLAAGAAGLGMWRKKRAG